MERLRVTRTHADGAVLRCAYHGLKAQGSGLLIWASSVTC
jgi:hypothetical protein